MAVTGTFAVAELVAATFYDDCADLADIGIYSEPVAELTVAGGMSCWAEASIS